MARFLELWAQQLECWGCKDIRRVIFPLSAELTIELTEVEHYLEIDDQGVHFTAEWLEVCLPVHLLAMLMTTKGVPLQPWAIYEFGSNILRFCRYDEAKFFLEFGITPLQLIYVFGLVGQAHENTTQVFDIQGRERVGLSALPLPAAGQPYKRPWDVPLVVDIGMGLGADMRYYLQQGFRVVAVEANPLSLEAALSDPGTKPYLLSGQLMVLNAAITGPDAAGDDTSATSKASFYVVDQRPEHSMMSSSLGEDGGYEVLVRRISCADLLRVFGQAIYMKVDVEFNTLDCLLSLSDEAANAKRAGSGLRQDWRPPKYLSLEVQSGHLVGPFHTHLSSLGYTHYKMCRQFIYSPNACEHDSYGSELLGCGSGPFGEAAADYLVGPSWKPLDDLLNDTKFLDDYQSDSDWFDIHAKLPDCSE